MQTYKHAPTVVASVVGGLLLAIAQPAIAADPAKYCTKEKLFYQKQFVEFVVDQQEIKYSDLRPKGDSLLAPTDASKLKNVTIAGEISRMDALYGRGFPYTLQEISKAFGPTPPKTLDAWESRPSWAKVPPITAPYLTEKTKYASASGGSDVLKSYGGDPGEVLRQKAVAAKDKSIVYGDSPIVQSQSSFGPIRLRKEVGSLLDFQNEARKWDAWTGVEDEKFKNEMKGVEGAKFGYKDDRQISGNGAWSTEGALILPYHYANLTHDSLFFHAALATTWNVEEQEGVKKTDINELKLSLPLGIAYAPTHGQFFFVAEPYYQTDTHFDGGIDGVTASFEYANPDYIGYYKALGSVGDRVFNVRFRARGLLDYSDVTSTSRYMSRKEGDDWLRAGAKVSLELGLFDEDKGKLEPITWVTSYQFLEEISGSNGGYSSLFKTSLNYWISDYVAVSAEYQKGETPIADKDIDLISLGLQVRY